MIKLTEEEISIMIEWFGSEEYHEKEDYILAKKLYESIEEKTPQYVLEGAEE